MWMYIDQTIVAAFPLALARDKEREFEKAKAK